MDSVLAYGVAVEVPEESISNRSRNTPDISLDIFSVCHHGSYAQSPPVPFTNDVRRTEVVQVPPLPYTSVVVGIRTQAPPLPYEYVDIGIYILILIIL
jgi:hypothetical protein